jgi:DNA-binding transcriptional MocR family regulator
MEITLEREASGLPVYRQIAHQIRAAVEGHRVGEGDRLPTIRALAEQLGVHRDTVAQAYDALARDGVVETTVGRGTFVTTNAPGVEPITYEPRLSPLAERVVAFDRNRPRFGSTDHAIPLHSLIPGPDLYPAEAFRKALNRVLQEGGPELLLYGAPQGHEGLRAALADRMHAEGMRVAADDVVLCHGASQGISLAMRLFAAQGDVVALEEPTYNNALATSLGLGIGTIPVPMRDDGVDLDALERTLARPEVVAFYTMPTFHNPLGTTTSLAHRRRLLEIAHRTGVPIIEDGFEMDLRFAGRPIPPLAALDDSGLVVHLFSFSKSLFPGARVGAIVARGRCVDALLALKQATDLSDAMPLQAALASLLETGEYERHLGRIRRELRKRQGALLGALARELPEGAHWTKPEGGYQVWCELPEAIDTADLLPDAVAAGVLFAPGSQFNHDGRPSHGMRLTFAMADAPALKTGAQRLGSIVRERLSRAPRPTTRVHI